MQTIPTTLHPTSANGESNPDIRKKMLKNYLSGSITTFSRKTLKSATF